MSNYKSPPNKSNLTGKKFGKLTVLEETDKRTKKQLVIYKCKCECENTPALPFSPPMALKLLNA